MAESYSIVFIYTTSYLSTRLLMDTAHRCLAGGLPLLLQPDKNGALTRIWTCSWSLRWAVYNGASRQAWSQLEPRFLPLFPRYYFSFYKLSSLLPFELWFSLFLFPSRLLEIKDGLYIPLPLTFNIPPSVNQQNISFPAPSTQGLLYGAQGEALVTLFITHLMNKIPKQGVKFPPFLFILKN